MKRGREKMKMNGISMREKVIENGEKIERGEKMERERGERKSEKQPQIVSNDQKLCIQG